MNLSKISDYWFFLFNSESFYHSLWSVKDKLFPKMVFGIDLLHMKIILLYFISCKYCHHMVSKSIHLILDFLSKWFFL